MEAPLGIGTVGMSAIGTKRTLACALHMSAFDPKRTLLFAVIPNIGGEFPFAADLFPHDNIFP
jgi:hypothetical protein